MTGSWEIVLILIVLAAFVGPRLVKRSQARTKKGRKPVYKRPEAREVEYEIEEDA